MNNLEIGAVTAKIKKEIDNANNTAIKLATKSKQDWEKDFKKTVKYKEGIKINLMIDNYKNTYNFDLSGWSKNVDRVSYFLSNCYEEYKKEVIHSLNIKFPTTDDIKNKIIIAQIECDNLQEIIDSIKKEYNLIVE